MPHLLTDALSVVLIDCPCPAALAFMLYSWEPIKGSIEVYWPRVSGAAGEAGGV